MKASIKAERELAKTKALLQSLGLDTTELEAVAKDVPEDVEVEADAVLLYIDTNGKHFVEKKCGYCERVFATTAPHVVGRCSNSCRAASLKEVGVVWNPYKTPKERWGRYVPQVVPPEALEVLTA